MTKVISIISEGHSGSTLCDLLIGTIPETFSTGECVYFPWQLHRDGKECDLNQDICSCGKKFTECPAWSVIINNLSNAVGYNISHNPLRFEMAMYNSQIYGKPMGIYDRILRAFFIRLLRHFPVPLAINFFSFHVRKQLDNNWLFFDTICKTMAVSHVIDSSKNIIRAKLLHQKRPQDVYIILLIRDIEGVAASSAKKGYSPIAEAHQWVKFYNDCLQILKRTEHINIHLLNYEDMVSNPEQAREKIAYFLGLPSPQIPLSINTRNHHLVAGNPMRYKGEILIKYDDSWKTVLSSEEKRQLYAIKETYSHIIKGLYHMTTDRH